MNKNVLNSEVSEAANSASVETPTFSDVEKGYSNETKIDYCTNEKSIVNVALDELEIHPLNHSIYNDADSNKVKSLAQNIKDHTLINRIIINKNLQILSGNLRFKALKLLNISQIEAYVIDLPQEDELEFIISSNQQRVKTIIDARNEIISLFEKYSLGQGNREGKGENTIKKVSAITGYSTNKISSIRKIDATFSSLLNEVDKGNMTLNAAYKQCDIIDRIKNLSDLIGEDLLKDLTPDKIEKTFDKGVEDYCKASKPEYYDMLMNNEMKTSQAYDKLFPNRKSNEEAESFKEHSHIDAPIDDSMYCPCCSQKVKKDNKELEWIKRFSQSITEYVANLKLPTNV